VKLCLIEPGGHANFEPPTQLRPPTATMYCHHEYRSPPSGSDALVGIVGAVPHPVSSNSGFGFHSPPSYRHPFLRLPAVSFIDPPRSSSFFSSLQSFRWGLPPTRRKLSPGGRKQNRIAMVLVRPFWAFFGQVGIGCTLMPPGRVRNRLAGGRSKLGGPRLWKGGPRPRPAGGPTRAGISREMCPSGRTGWRWGLPFQFKGRR